MKELCGIAVKEIILEIREDGGLSTSKVCLFPGPH